MKRVVAAEFSREKSRIVSHGKKRSAERGFRSGAPAPYGMKRIMVHPDGRYIQDLPPGARKALSCYKTKLAPATDGTASIVKKIFRLFVERKMTMQSIAELLTRSRVRAPRGGRWYVPTIRQILQNAAYTGDAVHHPWSGEAREIRVESAYQAVIERSEFEQAQAILAARSRRQQTRSEVIAEAREAFQEIGHLRTDVLAGIAAAVGRHHEEDAAVAATALLQDIHAERVSVEKVRIAALLADRFKVEDIGYCLRLANGATVAVHAGWRRPDLAGTPVVFSFLEPPRAEVLVCLALEPTAEGSIAAHFVVRTSDLKPPLRLLRRLETLKHSKLLVRVRGDKAILRGIQRALERGPAGEARFLAAIQTRETVTFAGIARELQCSQQAARRTYWLLRERGEPLPEQAYVPGRRVERTCSACGSVRSMRPSKVAALRSDLCGICSRARASSKVEVICPNCGAKRAVWPSTAKRMKSGMCHPCALSYGRSVRLAAVRAAGPRRNEKRRFLHKVGLLVFQAMNKRMAEFERVRLWAQNRAKLPTVRWRSPHRGDYHRLQIDCTDEFLDRCKSASKSGAGALLVDAILDRSNWIGGAADRKGERVWVRQLA
jgi:Recombinase